MTIQLFSQGQLDSRRSCLVASLTPEYGIGDCYPLNCLGQARALTHHAEGDLDEFGRWLWATDYCQGWFIRRFRDGSGVDAFPHGFLLMTDDEHATVIDGLAQKYGTWADNFWVPVQRWSYQQARRWMESETTHKAWPLTTRPGGLELEDRLGYRRALRLATEQLQINPDLQPVGRFCLRTAA
jgi:hypothetical protein